MTRKKQELRLAPLAAAMLLAGVSGHAGAAGFALIEQSASGLGNAFAGGAAAAEDATTIFYNPAGMTRLQGRQMVVAGHIISPTADFENDGSTDVLGLPLNGPDDEGGELAVVPNFYYVMDVDPKTKFGIGVTVPFGLETDYDDDWVGRYHALNSEVITLNINPSLAFKMTDRLSLGIGVSLQYFEATLSNAVDFAAICLGLADNPLDCGVAGPQQSDGKAEVSGDDWAMGFNLGLLYEFTERTRLGLAYRSKISHDLDGDADFTVPAATASAATTIAGLGTVPIGMLFPDQSATAAIDLPEMWSVSVYHEVNDRLAVMADFTRTQWSRFDELRVSFDSVLTQDSVTDENWDNNNRYSIGATYKLNPRWKLRGGLAYDETPIPDAEHRTARIPGNDRTWVALGVGYTSRGHWTVDVGYAHLFVDDTKIRSRESSPDGAVLNGTYENSVDIFSAQVSYVF